MKKIKVFYDLIGKLFVMAGAVGLPIFLAHIHWAFLLSYAFTIPQLVKLKNLTKKKDSELEKAARKAYGDK